MIYVIIFQFNLFIVITNKIYNFIVFHRSGILLFAYDFQLKKEIDDSVLKGSILIGINHILTNFRNQRDNLNLIRMQNRDIIFDYDKNFGYAILLITDHKNKIIEKAVRLFMKKFSEENKEILNKINEVNFLIDLSEFKNTKNILFQYFDPYIKNK
jgi:hypothetical protein